MSNELDWIAARVTQARKVHSSVTEAVSARVEELLNGPLSERELPQKQLTDAARALLAAMVPAPPKADTMQ